MSNQRDVVIIGGGLSGCTVAYELEKQGINYTLIEVKRQLGGSLRTHIQDGFVMDGGAFALANTLPADWLSELGLGDSLFAMANDAVAFKLGTGMLIQALEARIHAPRLMRMAVSSIGELAQGRCAICLENGLMFDAKTIVVALPARYAERIFYGYITPLTELLMDYRYDTIQRVSLGYRTADLPKHIWNPPDMGYVFIHRTEQAERVRADHSLLQFGMRLAPERISSPELLVATICHDLGLPEPLAHAVAYWAEADPISCYDDDHQTWLAQIDALLPAQVALIGSDYTRHAPATNGINRLDERIEQARTTAKRVADIVR